MLGSGGQKSDTTGAVALLEALGDQKKTKALIKDIEGKRAYAEQILADAKAQAQQIKADAKADAKAIIDRATAEADDAREKAQTAAAGILADANGKSEMASRARRDVTEREKACQERERALAVAEEEAESKRAQAEREQTEARELLADLRRRIGAHAEVWAGV